MVEKNDEADRSGVSARRLMLGGAVAIFVLIFAASCGGGDDTGDDTADGDDATGGDAVGEKAEDETPEELCNGCDPEGDAHNDGAPVADDAGDGVAVARAGTDVVMIGVDQGSYTFTLEVAADGQAVATATGVNTKWYNPRFIINQESDTNFSDAVGAFQIDVSFSRGREGGVAIIDNTFTRLADAGAEIVWVDPSTLQVTVSGLDVDISLLRVEMSVRIMDADDIDLATFVDDASWTAEG